MYLKMKQGSCCQSIYSNWQWQKMWCESNYKYAEGRIARICSSGKIKIIEKLPVTQSGKIDYRKLKDCEEIKWNITEIYLSIN